MSKIPERLFLADPDKYYGLLVTNLERWEDNDIEYILAPRWIPIERFGDYELEDGWYWVKYEDGIEGVYHFSPVVLGFGSATHFCKIEPPEDTDG